MYFKHLSLGACPACHCMYLLADDIEALQNKPISNSPGSTLHLTGTLYSLVILRQ